MATLTGPLLSLQASGSIAKAVTISNWKGRPYIKRRPTPIDPRSGPQRGSRAAMTWLAAQWTALQTAKQETWQTLAAQTNIPPYNAFISHNLERLTTGRGPSKEYPSRESDVLGTWSPAQPKVYDGIESISVEPGFTPIADTWGVLYFLATTEVYDPGMTYLRFIRTHPTGDILLTVLVDVQPGVWWSRCQAFTDEGVISPGTTANDGISLPNT